MTGRRPGDEFLAFLWRSFPTSSSVDWQMREAGKFFARALERGPRPVSPSSRMLARVFRDAIEDGTPGELLTVRCFIAAQATIHERTAEDLRRAAECLDAVLVERELVALDAVALTALQNASAAEPAVPAARQASV